MPKKTAYSRSGAQRSKTKQKSFELVRPVSDANVLETVEGSEEEESAEKEEIVDVVSPEPEEEEIQEKEVIQEEKEKKREEKTKAGKGTSAKAGAVVLDAPAAAESTPRSAAARLAARRLAAQKAQRTQSNLITVEHYSYVRKDLTFILILAVILFGTIIALHFILGG